MEELPVFRASKKRKLGRQKHGVASETVMPSSLKQAAEGDMSSTTHEVNPAATDLDGETSQSTVIRSRRQKPKHGVHFTNTKTARDDEQTDSSMAMVKTAAPTEDPLKDMSGRFTTSTGQVVDVDHHMMEYIDLQIAKRDTLPASKEHEATSTQDAVLSSGEDDYSDTLEARHEVSKATAKDISSATIPTHNQPNHLAEVSLANLPTPSTQKHQPQSSRPRKPRLGRDGKPMRPRPRKRANSADQARDRLVEQILAENRLEGTYDSPGPRHLRAGSPGHAAGMAGTNEDADERMAAEFQKQFMEGVAERQARQQQQQQQHISAGSAASKKTASAGVPEGPKLGGSRSARAKMQAALMAEKEKDREGKK